MAWVDNSLMWWYDGTTWQKITDHGRSPLSVSVERIENSQRMVDGTMRRYTVAKKRTWSCDWENLPRSNSSVKNGITGMKTADGGWAGKDIENFHNNTDGPFKMRLRAGIDEGKATTDASIEEVTVMITDYSREVSKRGNSDLWSVSITLEEV